MIFLLKKRFDGVSSCRCLPLFTVASIDPTQEQQRVFMKWPRVLITRGGGIQKVLPKLALGLQHLGGVKLGNACSRGSVGVTLLFVVQQFVRTSVNELQ